MAYTPLPNPWKNVPYVGALIDALQNWAAALVTNIAVRKEGAAVGTRPALNFIDGDNIALTVADDAGDDEVEVTVSVNDSTAVQFADLILYDTFANRPGFGIEGRLFYASDTQQLFRDSGAAWEEETFDTALDSDLVDIGALTPADDDVIQRKAGVWTNRTLDQLDADLVAAGLPAALVGYGTVSGRPAASAAGLLYYATDDGVLYRDNGSSWDPTVSDQMALIIALGGE